MTRPILHKFTGKRTELDGIKFPSKLHAAYYRDLELRKLSGDVLFYLREVPFRLQGGVTYRLDFLEFWSDGTVHFREPKGVETREFRAKMKMMKEAFPMVTIELVEKAGTSWTVREI